MQVSRVAGLGGRRGLLRRRRGIVNPRDPIGPTPDLAWPAGDGRRGVLEGFSSRIHYDASQPARWWLRSDSNGESALAFALRAELDGHEHSRHVAANLLDWLYFHSGLHHNDPERADFGLMRWAPDSGSLYADNDIKIILSCMGTAALLETDRWDYWGSNADHGWGAWAIEVGWTQGWIPTVLALRELDVNLWDLTKDSAIARHWEKTRAVMLPDDDIRLPEPERVEHAALDRPVGESQLRPPNH